MSTVKNRLTMTVLDVYYAMREAGIPTSPTRISAGIVSGAYPFGRVIGEGETGRKTFEIFRVDFEAWLESKTPASQRDPLAGCSNPLVLVRNVM